MEEVDVGRDFNRKTILVVDDEESIVDLLVYHLQKEGYNTLQAYDGASAVEIALKEKPDLPIREVTDWIDGEEFAKCTKSDAANNKNKLVGRINFVKNKLISGE